MYATPNLLTLTRRLCRRSSSPLPHGCNILSGPFVEWVRNEEADAAGDQRSARRRPIISPVLNDKPYV